MAVRVHIKEHIGRPHVAWWRRLSGRWSFIFWLAAIVLAIFLLSHGGRMGGMSGMVESDRQDLAPMETARLENLLVKEGDRVLAGDLVAVMDSSVLDAEMTVEKLQAERQFALAVTRAESELRDARIRQAERTGEYEVLDEEVTRLDALLKKQLTDARTVARVKARRQALKQSVDLYPAMITELEQNLAQARERLQELNESMNADTGYGRLGLLELRRKSYSLRAYADGIVSRIYYRPGDMVQGGRTILTIVGEKVQRIVGYLPESSARDVSVGMTAYVSSSSDPRSVVVAKVIAVTPDVLTLPNRVSPVPQRVLRGRRVILVPESEHQLLPGESVVIRFQRPVLSLLLSLGMKPPGSRESKDNAP